MNVTRILTDSLELFFMIRVRLPVLPLGQCNSTGMNFFSGSSGFCAEAEIAKLVAATAAIAEDISNFMISPLGLRNGEGKIDSEVL